MRRTTTERIIEIAQELISIHVLLAEDDIIIRTPRNRRRHFNPRPPCGGRQSFAKAKITGYGFQSTSSLRRTTLYRVLELYGCTSISIHVLLAEDDKILDFLDQCKKISIHVLLAEDDFCRGRQETKRRHFNPRPPCGGRRHTETVFLIHWDFNPRPPCGGRRNRRRKYGLKMVFQSTSSLRRTTLLDVCDALKKEISIHVLLAEDDG